MDKKAQIWTADFIVGFMIFLIGVILTAKFVMNYIADDKFSDIMASSETVTDYLLSEGVPADWTNDTVVKIGLTTDKRLNITKISMLYNMSFENTKTFLSSDYDYQLFFLNNNSLINFSQCSYGAINISECDMNISSLEYDNLVKTTRFVIFNGTIIEMVLYLWD